VKRVRPFLLYHWSPVSRRKSIQRHGLCPGKKSRDGSWRPPYLCFSRFPTVAWGVSATHSGKRGRWDLWCVWSHQVGEYMTRNVNGKWWTREYRSFQRVPMSALWLVGSRDFTPRKKPRRKTP